MYSGVYMNKWREVLEAYRYSLEARASMGLGCRVYM